MNLFEVHDALFRIRGKVGKLGDGLCFVGFFFDLD